MDTNNAKVGGTASNRPVICMCEGAIMVSLAIALGFFKIDMYATGGSIDLVMIPLFIYSLRRGPAWGIAAGVVFGTLDCIVRGGIAYGWQALILDYSLAFGLTGLSGLFVGRRPVLGALTGSAARYIMHTLSGVLIWSEYMPDVFLGLNMTSPWVYSIIYNATYMIPSAIIAIAAVLLLSRKTRLI